MGKLFIFGRTLGFHKAPFAVILKVPSSPMMTTVGLVHCELITLGHSTLSPSLFLPNFKILFKVFLWHILLDLLTLFLWHILLDLLTLFCGPTIMGPVQLNLLPNFFFNKNKYPGINQFGTGFGHYNAQKRSKFSFGKLCVTGYPLNNS